MATSTVVQVLLLVNLLVSLSQSQMCERTFTVVPGTESGSPLECNILGAEVRITCRVTGVGQSYGWYFTTVEEQAGQRENDSTFRIAADGRRTISSTSDGNGITSLLTIATYNSSDNGYYWCRLVDITTTPPVQAFIFPSQVVFLQNDFTEDQLSACTTALEFRDDANACALFTTSVGSTVVGTEFNLPPTEPPTTMATTKVTTAEETTTPPTTPPATTPDPVTTTPEEMTTIVEVTPSTSEGVPLTNVEIGLIAAGGAVFIIGVVVVLVIIVCVFACCRNW